MDEDGGCDERGSVLSEGMDSAGRLGDGDVWATVRKEMECVVCMKLLYDPLTLPCGHSFCRLCMIHAQDHSPRCPTCRAELLYFDAAACPTAITLQNTLRALFPNETNSRRSEDEATLPPLASSSSPSTTPHLINLSNSNTAAAGGAVERMTLPLFALRRVVFPGEMLSLCIFEPRYILMLQRCMRSSRRFALVHSGRVETLSRTVPRGAVATALRIESCSQVGAARFFILTRALHRVRVLSSHLADDYIVGITEKLSDSNVSPSSTTTTTLQNPTTTGARVTSSSSAPSPPPLPASSPTSSSSSPPTTPAVPSPASPPSLDLLVEQLDAAAHGVVGRGGVSGGASLSEGEYEQRSMGLSAALVDDADERYELLQMTSSRERLEKLKNIVDNRSARLARNPSLRRAVVSQIRSCVTQ